MRIKAGAFSPERRRARRAAQRCGWVTLDALLALSLWASLGLGMIWQTRAVLVQQRNLWQQTQALEWLGDLHERLRLARLAAPLSLGWGETVRGDDCSLRDCDPAAWRDHLLADWQNRLGQEWPQAQVWLAPWAADARLQASGLRWPERGSAAQGLKVNGETCPSGWRCVVTLGWP
ncbi:MAG: hypothetical protein RIT26_1922 [Pseudomonadota bacterium]|jgi:hypothetical protein